VTVYKEWFEFALKAHHGHPPTLSSRFGLNGHQGDLAPFTASVRMATFYEHGLFGLCGPNFFGSAVAANGNRETVARLAGRDERGQVNASRRIRPPMSALSHPVLPFTALQATLIPSASMRRTSRERRRLLMSISTARTSAPSPSISASRVLLLRASAAISPAKKVSISALSLAGTCRRSTPPNGLSATCCRNPAQG
jgi:hypothetical protein